MTRITANDLKNQNVMPVEGVKRATNMVSTLEKAINQSMQIDLEANRSQREYELEAALTETRADLADGRAVQESPEAHLARLGSFPTT